MSDVETVNDTATNAKMELLRTKIREYDEAIRNLNQIVRCLDLTRRYEKDTTTTAGGVTTTTIESVKKIDPQTGETITDEKRLSLNTHWLGKADTALGIGV